jgi:hypothetical protein
MQLSNFTKRRNNMSRMKRSSLVLETARRRLAGLKSINPAPDFGEGMNVANYEAEINAFAVSLNDYNQELAALDEKKIGINTAEENLRIRNRRILRATEARYGPDSSEFAQAGGKRVSEHKSRKRRPLTAEAKPGGPPSNSGTTGSPGSPEGSPGANEGNRSNNASPAQ